MGTHEGGVKAAIANRAKWGEDFYARIGARGGAKSTGYPFAHGKVDPHVAGAKGGSISKRTKKEV